MLKMRIIITTIVLLISANSLFQTVPGFHLGIFSLIKTIYNFGVLMGIKNCLEFTILAYLGDKLYQELLITVLDSTIFELATMLS